MISRPNHDPGSMERFKQERELVKLHLIKNISSPISIIYLNHIQFLMSHIEAQELARDLAERNLELFSWPNEGMIASHIQRKPLSYEQPISIKPKHYEQHSRNRSRKTAHSNLTE